MTDLVCYSHLRWNFVYQRPQHLMSRFAKNCRVFFIEEPIFDTDQLEMDVRVDKSRVVIAVPHIPPGLSLDKNEACISRLVDQLFKAEAISHPISWFYTPMALGFAHPSFSALTVYDCMDELSAFAGASPLLIERESQLFKQADLVFTGGRTLFEAKKNRHTHVHLFPSSIDPNHFRLARQPQADPFDQVNIPHPRLGYFGVMDERIDLNLLETVAKERPEWHLVMVGPTTKIDPAQLPQAANIHYLGLKEYQLLPGYLAGWDVAMLPFAINNSTRYISPTKTPEYLAGGRRVVSTRIQDVVDPYGVNGLVRIAGDPQEFIQAIEDLLASTELETDRLAKIDQFLLDNSWDETWKKMNGLIENNLTAKREENLESTGKMSVLEVQLDKAFSSRSDMSLTIKATDHKTREPAAFDYLIVGAGYAGSVMAERLTAGSGKRVLLMDRRSHIGGNAYDEYNQDGLLIHRYGPHIFHTNSREVFEYLSHFTEWRSYEHKVLTSVDGMLLPIPINLDTINQLYGLHLSTFEIEDFFAKVAEPRNNIRTSEDVVVSKVGRELYEKFFRNYTRKQWGLDPSELDASVTARVPIRMNRDNRYFTDTYQMMPLHGYTSMFERLLDHPNIKIMLNTDFREIAELFPHAKVIYTGPIDEYFNYCFGPLPYRSLDFRFETAPVPQRQPVAVINYPNDHLYTRVTEFKHLTGQEHSKTILVYEYPQAEGDPYYPIPRPENAAIYARYHKLAEATPGVQFAGRLGTYKYYNMDQVAAQALTLYAKIEGVERSEAARFHAKRLFSIPERLTRQVRSEVTGTVVEE